MAKRPAQGQNSTKKIVKQAAGGDNVRTSGGPHQVNKNAKRGYAS